MENEIAVLIFFIGIIGAACTVKIVDRKITEADNKKWRKQRGIE